MIVLRLGKLIEMALAEHGLTENQYRALGFIADGDPDLTEMAERLVMKRPNVTTLLDGLISRGLVRKQRRTSDRRRIDLTLTPDGEALFDDATRAAELALEGLSRLSGGTRGRLEGIDRWGPAVEAGASLYHQRSEADRRSTA